MKYITAKLFAGILVSGAMLASCTANYENINGNPYQPTTDQMTADDYMLQATMSALGGGVVRTTGEFAINMAQMTENLLGCSIGGYFASTVNTWNATIENYNPTDNWTYPFMTDVTPIIYTNLNIIKKLSEDSGNPVPAAIATVIKVAGMHRVADTYGPIPYSGVGVSFVPAYDPLEDVYSAFFDELNRSIEILSENRTVMVNADGVFGGDPVKWIRYANSLKLRLAMRIAYADPAKSKQMAEEAVAQEFGVITSNDGNALYRSFGPEGNPIGFASLGWGDSAVAADIVCYMNGYADPRRPAYFTASTWPSRTYVGLRHGISPIPDKSTVGLRYSFPNIKPTDPIQWMNAAEVAFLRAEGAAVFGYDMDGTAEELYNEGIRLSFEQWGLADNLAEAYMADDTSVPENYTDPYTAAPQSYAGTISTITIKWDESADAEEKQERIITQKWIANWTLGNEAWAEFRRTGYPHLIPATDAGNKSGGIVDSEDGARRMPYPQAEKTENTENYQIAVSQYMKGADNMATSIWWDCKNQ
jgi:hypothetical protein